MTVNRTVFSAYQLTALCMATSDDFTYIPVSDSAVTVSGLRHTDVVPSTLVIPTTDRDGHPVTGIAPKAFAGLNGILTVMIPASCESIGTRAFAFCESLSSIEFEENASLSRIGARAFIGCDGLRTVDLSGLPCLSEIGASAFAYCLSLQSVTLPGGLTELASGMFEGCRALTDVTLPLSLRVIGATCFSTCVSLERVVLPGGVYAVGAMAFAFCERLSLVVLPDFCYISPNAFQSSPDDASFRPAA